MIRGHRTRTPLRNTLFTGYSQSQVSNFPGSFSPPDHHLAFFSLLGISYYAPPKVKRWALAVGNGFVSSVVLRIIFDVVVEPRSHNIFPFEIVAAMLISAPFVYAGA